ncbi:MAG: methyl-accepting chemotaxis protein [Pseudomonadota bacterium]
MDDPDHDTGSDARRQARGLDLYSSDILAVIGRARGHALNIGTLALLCATAQDDEERAVHATELAETRKLYFGCIDATFSRKHERFDLHAVSAQRTCVEAFRDRVAALDEAGRIERAEAVDVAAIARNSVLPAIYAIVMAIRARELENEEEKNRRLEEKARLVDDTLVEMERIGRLIGFISINASVEAARTGGEGGRAFQVIAEEVRGLAQRSEELLAQTRSRLT